MATTSSASIMSAASSASTTAYPLDNSTLSTEIQRLEWQHHNVLGPLYGGLLPARVLDDIKTKKDVAVADIGTGTGIWLVELAPQLAPTARLDGFDINTAKFRPATALPPNVRLRWGDALDDVVDEELVGRYDVVHVRLLFLALQQPADWRRIAAHATALLRPGGWLVWEEIDLRTVGATPATSVTAQTLEAVLAKLMADRQVDPATDEWYPRDLGKLLGGELGYTDTEVHPFPIAARNDAKLTAAGNGAMRFVLQAYLYGVLAAAGGVEGLRTEADVAARLDAIGAELASGAATTNHDHVRVVGRKAA